MPATTTNVTIREMKSQADAEAFRVLNEEWIARWFKLEEKDIATLSNPQESIIARGGRVYVAEDAGRVVGTAALIPFGQHSFELSKMAVSSAERGKGIGRTLILHVLEQARRLGAGSVFLGSSKKLENAVHLYESVGFCHVPPSELPGIRYDRADVFMLLNF